MIKWLIIIVYLDTNIEVNIILFTVSTWIISRVSFYDFNMIFYIISKVINKFCNIILIRRMTIDRIISVNQFTAELDPSEFLNWALSKENSLSNDGTISMSVFNDVQWCLMPWVIITVYLIIIIFYFIFNI